MAEILKLLQHKNIKSKFKVQLDKVDIGNRVFRLFSNFTSGSLLVCATLITLKQLVGKNIECIPPPPSSSKTDAHEVKAINQYCFIVGTYTVPDLYNLTVGKDISHPGVGTFQFDHESDSVQHYHTWYQWVPIALFFQGITFIAPLILWKALENGQIRMYCYLKNRDIDDYYMDIDFNEERKKKMKEKREKKRKIMNNAGTYFVGNMSSNNFYAYSYIICELLNLTILILNFFWTNTFLGQNDFLRYGPEVVEFSTLENTTGLVSPQDRVFPKVSKCDFHKYGPSGGLVRYDILCVLAMNIMNEKIYMFLWFWFIILFGIGILALTYRLAVVLIPAFRNMIIRRRTDRRYIKSLDYCLEEMSYADWFVLKRLNHNMSSIRFGELLAGIKLELETPHELLTPTSSLPVYNESTF